MSHNHAKEDEANIDPILHVKDVDKSIDFYIKHSRVMTDANYHLARECRRKNHTITLVLLFLGPILVTLPFIDIIRNYNNDYINSLIAITASIMITITSYQYSQNFDIRSSAHEVAAREYSRLRRKLELLSISEDSKDDKIEAFSQFIENYNTCAAMSPSLTKEALVKFQKKYFS